MRKISVVIPMRNEERRISGVLEDVAAQDFSGELEVFVADGDSTDGSLERLRAAAGRGGLRVTVIENPDRLVASGLNACIPLAQGDLIVRLDCKARYPPYYLRRLAEAADRCGAWNVGGVLVPKGQTLVEAAVATRAAAHTRRSAASLRGRSPIRPRRRNPAVELVCPRRRRPIAQGRRRHTRLLE